MISIDEFIPDIPRPGWSGRRRAIAVQLGGTIIAAIFIVVVLWLAVLTAGAVQS